MRRERPLAAAVAGGVYGSPAAATATLPAAVAAFTPIMEGMEQEERR